jgi:regulator-associated protein of mTOR
MCAFIVAMFCKDFHQGQVVCLSPELIESCLGHLNDQENPLLRQWICLCISMLWVNFPEAKWVGIRCSAHMKLCDLVVDPVSEVRAAMLHALTTFLGIPDLTPQVAQIEETIASMVMVMGSDGNTMVRKELLVFFSTFIARYQNRFIVTAYDQLQEEQGKGVKTPFDESPDKSGDLLTTKGKAKSIAVSFDDSGAVSANTVFSAMWKQVLIMSVDPHPEIAQNAGIVVDCIFTALLESQLAPFSHRMMDTLLSQQSHLPSSRSSYVEVSHGHVTPTQSHPPTPPTPTKPEGYISASLKRTASVAASLKNLAFGTPERSHETSPKSPNFSRTPTFLDGRNSMTRTRTSDWNQPPDVKDQHHGASATYPSLKPPEPKNFRHRDVRDVTPSIPLKSQFYAWSVEYFREPQMKPSEADEPGSTDYNERLWRRNRNDRIIAKTQPLKELAGTHPWDRAKGFFNNGTQPTKMCFHQFEDHLVVGDDRDGLAIWDWKKQTRLNRFSNGNPARSKITEIRLINEDDQALLMTGSSDGVIKLFRNYESQRDVELVTAFRALTDLEPSTKNAGLVFDWQQSRGLILVAGDVRSIRVWNAGTEICTADINARSGSPITSLTSDQVEGHLFVAGFGDGALRLYDQRQKPQTAMVQVWKEHKAWVTNTHLQRGGQRELISACRNGEVKLWDMRWDKSIRTIKATKDTLRTLSVHEHAPVFAVGTDRHVVKIFSTAGTPTASSIGATNGLHLAPPTTNGVSSKKGLLNSFEPYSGFLNQNRSSPISCTSFHPHRMMIAGAAMGDTHINIYTCAGGKGVGKMAIGGGEGDA